MPTKTRPSFVITFVGFQIIFQSGCFCYLDYIAGRDILSGRCYQSNYGSYKLQHIVDRAQKMTETTLKIPKIKKCQFLMKLLVDPSELKKGLPQSPLPELTDKGIIISLVAQKAPLAKLSPEGSLKLHMKYNAEVIELIDRYVEVTVIDDYDNFWMGTLFGITVRGTGGHGVVRGCRATGIQGQTILVEFVIEGENQHWKKFQSKVADILTKTK